MWWSQLVDRPDAKLHAHITPGSHSWIGVSSGIRGLNLNYVVLQDECAAELYIDRGKDSDEENKLIYDQLFAAHDEINKAVSRKLSWERLDGRRASRVRISLRGGYRSPEEAWGEIQADQVAAMNELEQALRPYLKKLKLGN